MSSRADILLHLLHTTTDAVLADNSIAPPNLSVESRFPFVPDQRHCPIFLESRKSPSLLREDPANLVLAESFSGMGGPRATIVGRTEPVVPDDLLIARYLRYQPGNESSLRSGDFDFFRFVPTRIRITGCHTQGGWLETDRFFGLPTLPLAEEAAWIAHYQTEIPQGVSLLGIDPHGIDAIRDGRRVRILFRQGPVTSEAIGPSLSRMFSRLKRDKAIADSYMTPAGLFPLTATSCSNFPRAQA